MANGSIHPKEQELKERLGKDYETENPPVGARILGAKELAEMQEAAKVEAAGEGIAK
jgi:hypothetical protein